MDHQELDERMGATSASNAQADSLCPGRHLAQRGIEEGPKSDDANFGTAIHDALAKQDPSGLTLDQMEVYDACMEIEHRLIDQYFGRPAIELFPVITFREKRLWAGILCKHSGRIDAAHACGQKGLIVEYKTLPGEVPSSPRNLQLRDQVCIWQCSREVDNKPSLKVIGCAVIQPFVTRHPEICEYNQDQITRAVYEMGKRVGNSNRPDAPRIAGEIQCKFCRAKPVCKEYGEWASSLLPTVITSPQVPMEQWSPETWARFLKHEKIAREWLDLAHSRAIELLKQNEDAIPGWGLEEGDNRETITDTQECFNRFRALGGSLEAFLGCLKITKKKLREALSNVTGARGERLDRAMEALARGISTYKQNKPSVYEKKEERQKPPQQTD